MAVPEQTPYIEHTGNGATTSFSLGFQCESKDHLIVLVDEIEPPIATWSLNNGNVVFTTAPAAGKKITVQRNTPFGRTANYQSFNNSFRPQTVNKDFDWIWLKLQELGVADWILSNRINDLRAYVDKQDNVLQENIDNLKNYVDDKDDELRNYLSNAIREQGVALDQLEEYYSYLMQQLAQVAIDRGWAASFIVSADGSTQQEINDRIGNTWYAKPLGYELNARVMLTNGDIVKSTIPNNTNDPNVDMTEWVKINSASQIIDVSGKSQQDVNNGIDSIDSLLSIVSPTDGTRLKLKSYHAPNYALANPYNGGSDVVYVASMASVNDGVMCFNGWVRLVSDLKPEYAGAKGDGISDDRIAFQKCLDYASNYTQENGVYLTLELDACIYKIGSIGGYHELKTSDNGTGTAQAYNGSTASNIAAEQVNSQAHCLSVLGRYMPHIVGKGKSASIIRGNFNFTNIGLNNPSFLNIDGSAGVAYSRKIQDFNIENFFIGLDGHNQLFSECNFNGFLFQSCGISMLTRYLERNTADDIHFWGCGSGWVNGGMWSQRCDNYAEIGGWADKNKIGRITGQSLGGAMSSYRFQALDQYYDTYYFKTANNTSRKYPTGGTGTPATSWPYLGISGRTMAWMSRYYRPNSTNSIVSATHMNSARPALLNQASSGFEIGSMYLEAVGDVNAVPQGSTGSGGRVGVAYTDPYRSTQYDDLLFQGAIGNNTSVRYAEVQHSTAKRLVLAPTAGFTVEACRITSSSSDENSIPSSTPRNDFVDGGGYTVGGALSFGVDQNTNGNRFGSAILDGKVAAASGGFATTTFSLPRDGVYIVTVRATGNGAIAHTTECAYLVSQYSSGGTYYISKVAQLGDVNVSIQPGTIKPSALALTSIGGGAYEASATTTHSQQVFSVFATRVG